MVSGVSTVRRRHSAVGFLLTFFGNMLVRTRWLLLILLLLVLHFLIGAPLWLFWLSLGLWLGYLLLLAAFCAFANYCGNLPQSTKPNINPYSARSTDMIPHAGSGEEEEKLADFDDI